MKKTVVITESLFSDDGLLSSNAILERDHYLGPSTRGFVYRDDFGILVFANPNSRRLPQDRWLELIRWCLKPIRNAGSQQWRSASTWLRKEHPHISTIVSYSDPSHGHTGALYRACNWLWAPTWHRLREPPSGNGNWGTGKQSPKDRWIFCLDKDAEREKLLSLNDESLLDCGEEKWPTTSRRTQLRRHSGV